MSREGPDDGSLGRARQVRLAAVVITVAALAWMAAQWAGGTFGWEARFAFLFDFAAIAAFVWALAVAFRVWRQSQG